MNTRSIVIKDAAEIEVEMKFVFLRTLNIDPENSLSLENTSWLVRKSLLATRRISQTDKEIIELLFEIRHVFAHDPRVDEFKDLFDINKSIYKRLKAKGYFKTEKLSFLNSGESWKQLFEDTLDILSKVYMNDRVKSDLSRKKDFLYECYIEWTRRLPLGIRDVNESLLLEPFVMPNPEAYVDLLFKHAKTYKS